MIKFNLENKTILKLIALALAIVTWFYVNGELLRTFGPKNNSDKSIPRNSTILKK